MQGESEGEDVWLEGGVLPAAEKEGEGREGNGKKCRAKR